MAVHVLWVIRGLGPGGAERLLANLAAAHDPEVATFECAYVVPNKNQLVPALEAAGVPCECVSRRARDPRWPLRLGRKIRGGDFDVVHVHSPLAGSIARVAARTVPKERRPVVITTEHSVWKSLPRPIRWLNRFTNRNDRFTFAVNSEVAGSLRGPVVDRSAVLVHGIDLEAVASEASGRDEMRASLGLGRDDLAVVTVAAFRAQKDYGNLLRACAELQRRGVVCRVLAVGQGPLADAMTALRDEMGLASMVEFLGYRPDAVRVMAAADVFVLSSKWEGLPVALMEAVAVGLPCVLTAVGGMPDAMGSDGAEWVPPSDSTALADALQRVLQNPDRRARLAQRSLAASAAFDVSRAAREIEHVYAPPVPEWPTPLDADHLDIRRATADDEAGAIALCAGVFGDPANDFAALFRWKHRDNPFGTSPMWVAVHGGTVVAVRVFMRWQFERDGQVVRAVRAVDTATHADHQGKGLFTALTLQGLAELEAEGVELVFNTPNEQSRPGYLKMGWRDVGRVRPVASVRPTAWPRAIRSRVPAETKPDDVVIGESVEQWLAVDGLNRALARRGRRKSGALATSLTEEFVRWRFGSAVQPCRVVHDARAAAIVERRRRGHVIELVCLLGLGPPRAVDRLLRRTMRLARADVALRLGDAAPFGGFVPLPLTGPRLTCRMLRPDPMPTMSEWSLTMADVVSF